MNKRTERVAELLERALEEVEKALGVRLADEKVEGRGQQALPVFLHELLHEAVDQAFPGLFDRRDPKADLVGEILVRVLEDAIKDYEGLAAHWRAHRDVHLFVEKVLKMLGTGRMPGDAWWGLRFRRFFIPASSIQAFWDLERLGPKSKAGYRGGGAAACGPTRG
ncbi:MAG: hypothetical protein ACUVQS_02235 [Candidatus Bipolaricaulaceae bacterium]